VQLGYNFLFSLWKYQWDADCELFLKVLTGELQEEVYLAQINLQKDLEDLFYSLDKAKGVQNGIIPKVGKRNCAYEQDRLVRPHICIIFCAGGPRCSFEIIL
jgi:hypothetical protein